MAKKSSPMMQSGGSATSKMLCWLVGIAVLVLVVQYPTDAAAWTRAAFEVGGSAVNGLVTFFKAVGA